MTRVSYLPLIKLISNFKFVINLLSCRTSINSSLMGQRMFYRSCDTEILVLQRGYPIECHDVITADGYILQLHRVPHGYAKIPNTSFYPVLLQHGLWSSSADWMLPDTPNSLGYQLADSGFDVWLGNSRGNIYSRRHITLSTHKQSDKFWNFSFHEMGIYDLPAVIDCILKVTGKQKLYYVGHSQGTTIFFVLASLKPEYNNKIGAMVGLAPVAFLSNIRSPFLRTLANMSNPLMTVCNCTGFNKLLPENWIIKAIAQLSEIKSDPLGKLASSIFINMGSYTCDAVKKSLLSIALSHVATGASLKQLSHFAQLCKHDRNFRQYDYGFNKNIEIYGTPEPPEYSLRRISCPVKLFYSDHDWLIHPRDAESVYDMLPNKHGLHKVPLLHFNHLDFIWSSVGKEFIFDMVVQFFKNIKV